MSLKRHVLLVAVGTLYLGAGENAYYGDEFVNRHSDLKNSFINVMATNRASVKPDSGSSHVVIKNKKEFKEAMKAGKLSQSVDTSKITKTYKVIDVKNVRLSKRDLKDVSKDRLLIGSKVDGDGGKLIQNINIKNSKIDVDRKVNIGVVSAGEKVSGVETSNRIDHSLIRGANRDHKERRSIHQF